MPRYSYSRLKVTCLTPQEFNITDLRKAVECLRSIPGADAAGTFIGLVAETKVSAGKFKLLATPMLTLPEIIGKTPAQIWEIFDGKVDKAREGLERRGK